MHIFIWWATKPDTENVHARIEFGYRQWHANVLDIIRPKCK